MSKEITTCKLVGVGINRLRTSSVISHIYKLASGGLLAHVHHILLAADVLAAMPLKQLSRACVLIGTQQHEMPEVLLGQH